MAPYALLFSTARRQAKGRQGNACQKHGLSYFCVKSMRAVKLVLEKRSQSNLGELKQASPARELSCLAWGK